MTENMEDTSMLSQNDVPGKRTKNRRLYQYLATISASSSLLAIGANIAWTSPYLPYLLSEASSIPTSPTAGSCCAVAPLAGASFGALLAAFCGNMFGRKSSILLLAPITFLSLLSISIIQNIWIITGFRFLIGVTDGALYTLLPMYVGEIVDPEIRGFLSSMLYSWFIVGVFFMNVIGPILTICYSTLVVSVLPAIHFVTFLFMPESPYYYVKKEKYQLAEASLVKLKGPQNAHKELNILKNTIHNEPNLIGKPRVCDLVTVPSNRKACYIFLMLLWCQRMSGKMPLMLFTTTIFQESGSSIDPTLSVIIYSAVEVLVVILVTPIIDNFSRRFLIILSSIGCAVTTFCLAVFFHLKDLDSPWVGELNWLPIVSLVAHNVLFNVGIGYCTMNYLSELFPMSVKAYASCAAEISVVLVSIITAQFFQITSMFFSISVPFYCFSVLCAGGVIFIYKYVPETRGKTLAEIQDYLIRSCENKNVEQCEEALELNAKM